MKFSQHNRIQFCGQDIPTLSKTLLTVMVVLGCLFGVWVPTLKPVSANQLSNFTTVTNTDFASFGVGGMFNSGSGILKPRGIPNTVSKAYLYWHLSSNTIPTSAALFDGNHVLGAQIGFTNDGSWSLDWNSSYRADVTAFYQGGNPNHDYTLSISSGVSGASLIVFYQDGNSANNRNVYLFDGNDANYPNTIDPFGWGGVFNGINYLGGDGESYPACR